MALKSAPDDGKAAADPLAEILNIAAVSDEHRLVAEADLEERLYTVLKYKDTEITKLDRDSRSLLKKIRTAAENLADSIKELSQDAHRTIDAEMRFGVGARQVAEEIESVFHGARSYLGIDDCEFSLRRLISCIHSELWPQAKAPYRPSGSVQNPNLEWLVGELHAWFYRYGKEKLSIRKSRDGTLRGSLPRVLSILQPWLSGTVPHNLSYSTLRRMLIRAKKQPSGDNSV